MSVLTTTPPATQASILRTLARSRYPKLDKPNVAASHHMSLIDLDAILSAHGWPDPELMTQAADKLEQQTKAAARGDERLGTLTEIPVGRLHPDPENPRDELRDIDELADSMREAGLLQPIIARRHEGRLLVVAGHRRLAAAKHLKWASVPCIVRGEMKPDHVLAAMLIENGQRSDLDPIEEARGLNRLKVQLDCSQDELARRVGRSGAFVSNRLALLALSTEDQEALRNGTMRLVEASHRGRLNSGKVKPAGQTRGWHLGPENPLAQRVKARCQRLGHSRGRSVGGMGCGACWEEVLRADERQRLHDESERRGRCVLCDAAHDPDRGDS